MADTWKFVVAMVSIAVTAFCSFAVLSETVESYRWNGIRVAQSEPQQHSTRQHDGGTVLPTRLMTCGYPRERKPIGCYR